VKNDCPERDDESFSYKTACSFDLKDRMQCPTGCIRRNQVQARQPNDVCYSSEFSRIGKCLNPMNHHAFGFGCEWLRTGSMVWKDDAMDIFRFWQMCDGRATYINAEDERHCDIWKRTCNRVGDICNGHWDCFDGSDEANCESNNSPRCDNGFQYCFTFSQLTCISVSKIGDGIIDCLGATDERNNYCLYKYPNEPTRRFRCANSDKCVEVERICDGYVDCSQEDDELICPWRRRLINNQSCSRGMFACENEPYCRINGRDRCKTTTLNTKLCRGGEDKWFCDLTDGSGIFSFVSLNKYEQFPPYERFITIDIDQSNVNNSMMVKSQIITKSNNLFQAK
jgi:hypothetical protein